MAKITKETLQVPVNLFEVTKVNANCFTVKLNKILIYKCNLKKEAKQFVKKYSRDKHLENVVIQQNNF